MRRRWVWAAALLLAWGATAAAADRDEDDPIAAKENYKPTWFESLFGQKSDKKSAALDKEADKKDAGKKDADKKEADKKDADKKEPDRKPLKSVQAEEKEAAARRAKEEADLLRRQAVCDQIRQVAVQAKDDELLRQVDQLERQAWEVYTRHVRGLPGALARFGSDEQILEKHLGPGSSPAKPRKDESSATRTSRAAREEEQ